MRSSFFVISLLLTNLCAGADTVDAPNMDALVIDQIPIHALACGPVALLNAYQLSSDDWRASTHRIKGSAEEKFNYFTKTYCSRFSRNTYQKRRWDDKNGIRPDDLTEAINELHKKAHLPAVRLERLFLTKGQTHPELLVKLHASITQSLMNGFPPLLYISRFVKITPITGGHRWSEVSSHFITITSTPKILEVGSQTCRFSYVDPWGGRRGSTSFSISESIFFANDITNRKNKKLRKNPTLVVPRNTFAVGASLAATNQPQVIAVTHLIVAKSTPTTLTP